MRRQSNLWNIVTIRKIAIMKLFKGFDWSTNPECFGESRFSRNQCFDQTQFSENQNFPEDVRLLPFCSNPSKLEHLVLQVRLEDLVLLFFLLKVDDFDFSSVLYRHVIFSADEDHLSPNLV